MNKRQVENDWNEEKEDSRQIHFKRFHQLQILCFPPSSGRGKSLTDIMRFCSNHRFGLVGFEFLISSLSYISLPLQRVGVLLFVWDSSIQYWGTRWTRAEIQQICTLSLRKLTRPDFPFFFNASFMGYNLKQTCFCDDNFFFCCDDVQIML